MELKKILISAGEASGDIHAAGLVKALAAREKGLKFTALGGPELKAAGANVRIELVRYAVIGFAAVISKLPGIIASYRSALKIIREEKPDMFVAVDYPGFNLKLMEAAKKAGVRKTGYFITPQVWLWGGKRIETMKKCCDFVINILPFEKRIFEEAGIKAFYFGHPLAHVLRGVKAEKKHPPEVGIFPGSRKSEIRDFMTEISKACVIIKEKNPEVVFRVFRAPAVRKEDIESVLRKKGVEAVFSEGSDLEARKGLSAAIVKSGTVTLETALLKVPFAAVYRLKGIDYMIIKNKARGTKVRYVTLPNIIAGKEVVREMIQEKFTAENTAEEINSLLKGGERVEKMKEEFDGIETALMPVGNPYELAAEAVIGEL